MSCHARYGCISSDDNPPWSVEAVASSGECRSLCQILESCAFFTWRKLTGDCLLLSSCDQLDLDCDACWTGDMTTCQSQSAINLLTQPASHHVEVRVGDRVWFTNRDVAMHMEGQMYSAAAGTLAVDSGEMGKGRDSLGRYVGVTARWSPEQTHLVTRVRQYRDRDMIVFSQDFNNYDTDINGVSVATSNDSARNEVTSIFPSLVPHLENDLSYLSYGGFMSGWAALSVGNLKGNSTTIYMTMVLGVWHQRCVSARI